MGGREVGNEEGNEARGSKNKDGWPPGGREVEDAKLNYLTGQREFDEADLDLGDKGATRLFTLPTSYPCSLLDNHGPGMVIPKRSFDRHRALFLFLTL